MKSDVTASGRFHSFGCHAALLVAAAATILVGCQSAPEAEAIAAAEAPKPPETWGTKADSVLPRVTDEPSFRMPGPIAMHRGPELRADAIALLGIASTSTAAVLRANAIEAMEQAPADAYPLVEAGLRDQNRGVRFVAAMTAGRLRMTELVPRLEELRHDTAPSVQAAAMYALKSCGRRVDIGPLAGMVMSNDPEVKGNAALVLGELGEASALPMLREAVRRRLPSATPARQRVVDLQLAEAMVKLGATGELEIIRAALFAPDEQGEIVVLACQLCGRLGDRTYVGTLRDIATRTIPRIEAPEVRLAAVQALAQIEPAAKLTGVATEYLAHERPEVRAQAAAALGWMGDPAVLGPLSATLGDRHPMVQVASAGAILRITRDAAGTRSVRGGS